VKSISYQINFLIDSTTSPLRGINRLLFEKIRNGTCFPVFGAIGQIQQNSLE